LTATWAEAARALRGCVLLVTPGDRDPARTADLVRSALDGGVGAVLLREPQLPLERLQPLAVAVTELCRRAGAIALVHRDPALALACGADGVHTGYGGPSIAALRAAAPALLVGRSAHWPLQPQDAEADYLLLSPFRATSRSHPRPLLTPAQVAAVLARTDLGPVLALGGLTLADVPALPAGLAGVAVVRAIAEAPPDAKTSAARLVAAVARHLLPGAVQRP
jgi:thiamine-phosphate diphosphorylase